MKILAINGSHRAGQNTAFLLNLALEEAKARGAETELIELSELNIEYCNGCNRCLGKPICPISDDMDELKEKMLEADGGHFGLARLLRKRHRSHQVFYRPHPPTSHG